MVCIIDTGAHTPVGRTAAASAASVRAGISRLMEHPFLEDRDGEPIFVGHAYYIDEEVEGKERFLALGLPAMRAAMSVLDGIDTHRRSLRAFVGLPGERPGIPADLQRHVENAVAEELEQRCPNGEVTLLAQGHASGIFALDMARQALDSGEADFCLVGGIDSLIHPATLRWLEKRRRLLCSSNSHGFIPGEAAGFLLLTSREIERELELAAWARVVTVATASEEHSLDAGGVCLGDGLTGMLDQLFQHLPVGYQIRHLFCDLNGEPHRTTEYGYAALRLGDHFVDPSDYWAPVDAWGDVGAATGPLLINLFCHLAHRARLKDVRALVWTGSDAGDRAGVLLESPSLSNKETGPCPP